MLYKKKQQTETTPVHLEFLLTRANIYEVSVRGTTVKFTIYVFRSLGQPQVISLTRGVRLTKRQPKRCKSVLKSIFQAMFDVLSYSRALKDVSLI